MNTTRNTETIEVITRDHKFISYLIVSSIKKNN